MIRLCKIFKNFLAGVFILASVSVFSQEDKLILAEDLYRRNQHDSALVAIDSAIHHPQTKNDFATWTTRAYIYQKIYLRTDKNKLNSALRDSVISSLRISESLKPDSSYQDQNRKMFKTIGAGFYRIAKIYLDDSTNFEKCTQAFNKYKEVYKFGDPSYNFNAKEIEFNLAVGSKFSNIYNSDNTNAKASEIVKVAFLKVLEIDPNNVHANLGLGLLYYNQAVVLVKSLDGGVEFTEIDMVQDNMIKLGKQSLGLITNAYKHEPENQKAIEALYYIYRILSDMPMHEEFKKKCIERNIDIGEKKPDENKENKDNTNQQNKDK